MKNYRNTERTGLLEFLVVIFLKFMISWHFASTEIRSTSFSFAYSIAIAIFGSFTPIIATELIYITGNKAIRGVLLSFAPICSLITVFVIKRRYKFNKKL